MRTTFLSLVLVVLAAPALAVDGVLEINQTCATQTGCFAGDAAGWPVTISAVGSFRLTSNLDVTGANETVIQITTADVVLDLNGHTIRCLWFITPCAGNGTGIGISASGFENIKVGNGTIRDMGSVGARLGDGCRVTGVSAMNNGSNGFDLGSSCLVSETVSRSNGAFGISVDSESTVERNAIHLNTSGGLSMLNGNVARGNTVNGNEGTGIVTSAANLLQGNVVRGNSGDGISCSNGGNTLLGNTIQGNGGLGLSLTDNILGINGFADNVISANNNGPLNPQTSGGLQLGPNICGLNTTCP